MIVLTIVENVYRHGGCRMNLYFSDIFRLAHFAFYDQNKSIEVLKRHLESARTIKDFIVGEAKFEEIANKMSLLPKSNLGPELFSDKIIYAGSTFYLSDEVVPEYITEVRLVNKDERGCQGCE